MQANTTDGLKPTSTVAKDKAVKIHPATDQDVTELVVDKIHVARKATGRSRSLRGRRMPLGYEPYLRPTARTLVLSDVDGTLLRGSLVLDHACMLHDSQVIDLKEWPSLWRADPKNEEHIVHLADSYRASLVGMKESELRIPEFIDSVISDPSKLYSSLERLKQHHQAGHHVVLISGSPSYLVGPFAKNFGFEVVASRYHRDRSRRLTGKITGMFGAEQKEAVVRKLALDSYDLVVGYGDTSSDVPLLRHANYSVLVDPNEETLRKIGDLKISEVIRS